MEFMLLPDNGVKAFETLPLQEDVVQAMRLHEGLAYYWYNPINGWYCIKLDHLTGSAQRLNADDVPDVIKLAAMLE
jgi:hypothetical protein